MKPDEYFEAFVLGNKQDCTESPGCLRRVFNAAVSASHMADHYFEYNRKHNPPLVAEYQTNASFIRHLVQKTDGAFADIRSISNAYKHLYEERRRGRPHQWTVASGGSIETVQYEGKNRPLQSIEVDYSVAADAPVIVVFRRRDGTRGEFLPVLDRVVGYWIKTLWPPKS